MADRVFRAKDRHGAEMEFEIIDSTRAVEMEADINYRKAYVEALKEGLLPREALRKMMRDNDIWTDQHEKELKECIRSIAKLEVELSHNETAGNQEHCLKVAGDLAKSRRRMWELALIQQSAFMNSSCEAYAEMIRIESQLAASVVIKVNGQRYWKDYSEYVLERDTNEISTVPTEAMSIANKELGEQQRSITENHPEQKWLEKFKLDTAEARENVQKELKEKVEAAVGTDEVQSPARKAKAKRTKVRRKRVAKKPR